MTPPLRFLARVGFGWTALRAAALLVPLPWLAIGPALLPDGPRLARPAAAADLARVPLAEAMPPATAVVPGAPVMLAALIVLRRVGPAVIALEGAAVTEAPAAPPAVGAEQQPVDATALAIGAPIGLPPAHLPPPAMPGHGVWSGTAWLFARRGGIGDPAAPVGTLGGSQAGARIEWRPRAGSPVALTARLSSPVGGVAGAESAIGVDVSPLHGVPVRVSLERRVAIDHGGRNAWTAYAAGGIYGARLPGGLTFDGYAEGGVVGARRGDLFADGGVRVGRPLALGRRATVTVGAGSWAAAQPGVSRLDIGPQAALRLPVGKTGISAAADWRVRVAGHAAPRSGPALTLGVDF